MSEAPERIYMDPDIMFPECEKQYGCDIQYVRGDLVEDAVKKLGDSLVVAEAKLAKAASGLKDVIGMLDDPHGGEHVRDMRGATLIARKALAALKGEDWG